MVALLLETAQSTPFTPEVLITLATLVIGPLVLVLVAYLRKRWNLDESAAAAVKQAVEQGEGGADYVRKPSDSNGAVLMLAEEMLRMKREVEEANRKQTAQQSDYRVRAEIHGAWDQMVWERIADPSFPLPPSLLPEEHL